MKFSVHLFFTALIKNKIIRLKQLLKHIFYDKRQNQYYIYYFAVKTFTIKYNGLVYLFSEFHKKVRKDVTVCDT